MQLILSNSIYGFFFLKIHVARYDLLEIAYSQYHHSNVVKKSLVVLLSLVIVGLVLSFYFSPISEPSTEPSIIEETFSCSGSARCISGTVTRNVDGDTIVIDRQSIRFTLTSAPKFLDAGGREAKQFVEQICPVASKALVDEDDGRTGGFYGSILAVVYCNGVNLNSALLESGLVSLDTKSCSKSEFSGQDWARNYGC